MENEILGLRAYVTALELQNRSRSLQQEVLHRELQTLNAQLSEMQQYYFQNRELVKQIAGLRLQMDGKDAEIDQLSAKLQEYVQNLDKTVELQSLLKEQQNITSNLKQNLQQALKRESNLRQILDIEKTMLIEQKVNKDTIQQQNQDLKRLLEIKETYLTEAKTKINQTQTNESEFPTPENGEHLLALRIEELEEEGEEREDKMKEMGDYIEELEYCCESLNNKLKAKEIEVRQLTVEITYLQKQLKLAIPIPKKSADRFHRSQVATPRWKESQTPEPRSKSPRLAAQQNQKENYSMIIKSSSECSNSQSDSVLSMNQQANRLQRRNSILKKQNEMLLRNMAV